MSRCDPGIYLLTMNIGITSGVMCLKSVRSLSEIEHSSCILANFCPRYVSCDISLWLLDTELLQSIVCRAIKLCTKF